MRKLFIVLFALACSVFGQTLVAVADDAAISEAHAAYQTKATRKTRKALLTALGDYSGEPTIVTVNAYVAVLSGDSKDGKPRKIRESASGMADHLEPVSEILPQQYIEARYMAAASLFNSSQDDDAIIEMTHVEGFARRAYYLNEEAEWAEILRYKADAWGMAMEAYFVSIGRAHPSRGKTEAILATYWVDTEEAEASELEEEEGLPFCEGTLVQKPAMRYPRGAGRKGMFGAVIIEMSFDDAGQVVDPRVRASIPVEPFADKASETVGKWRYEAAEDQHPGETCSLRREKVILPLVFQLR